MSHTNQLLALCGQPCIPRRLRLSDLVQFHDGRFGRLASRIDEREYFKVRRLTMSGEDCIIVKYDAKRLKFVAPYADAWKHLNHQQCKLLGFPIKTA